MNINHSSSLTRGIAITQQFPAQSISAENIAKTAMLEIDLPNFDYEYIKANFYGSSSLKSVANTSEKLSLQHVQNEHQSKQQPLKIQSEVQQQSYHNMTPIPNTFSPTITAAYSNHSSAVNNPYSYTDTILMTSIPNIFSPNTLSPSPTKSKMSPTNLNHNENSNHTGVTFLDTSRSINRDNLDLMNRELSPIRTSKVGKDDQLLISGDLWEVDTNDNIDYFNMNQNSNSDTNSNGYSNKNNLNDVNGSNTLLNSHKTATTENSPNKSDFNFMDPSLVDTLINDDVINRNNFMKLNATTSTNDSNKLSISNNVSPNKLNNSNNVPANTSPVERLCICGDLVTRFKSDCVRLRCNCMIHTGQGGGYIYSYIKI